MSAFERHLPEGAVALHAGTQLGRERIDHAGADPVQAACGLVVALLELPSRMQHREDHFERALLRLGMLVDRNPSSVVSDRDRAAVLVQCQGDVRGIAIHRFVDGVVEDLPDQMMEAGGTDTADVHARTLANGLEAFENGDVFRCVGGHRNLG
jgi:hypothetical protein